MRDRRAGKESANMGLYLNPGNETFAELGSDIKNKISHFMACKNIDTSSVYTLLEKFARSG